MKSNNLLQIDLPLARDMQPVDIEVIRKQPSLSAAIKLCISLSGFDSEKQIYMTLGIDAGHWTRISKGDAHFPQDKLEPLMDLCGNEVPLIWLANRRGYELKQLQSEVEKELEKERREKEEILLELKHLKSFISIKGGA
ncbi:MAG: hypothetical protein N0C84_05740 [Candidatus Thiodiazotropha taylori]|uniref:Uncharacterized protein n=1 Tax=Candidatus Thiodiazotropha taylori TaxID=2792791 RepID=A0A9E4N3K2_9GAMM|nr:hypothetical protein [Candidatus Thiodiazotropha taylori]MCW4255955.1 hypothetical protein [Candidatus Thiodiazotropha taylori]